MTLNSKVATLLLLHTTSAYESDIFTGASPFLLQVIPRRGVVVRTKFETKESPYMMKNMAPY